MKTIPEPLPDDLNLLKQLLKDCSLELERSYAEIEGLKTRISQLLAQLYGKTSEHKKNLPQPEGFDEPDSTESDPDPAPEAETAELEEQAADSEASEPPIPKPKQKSRKLPDYLEREEMLYDLSTEAQICDCGHPMHQLGFEELEQLKYVKERLEVLVHRRAKYGCRSCETKVKTAPMPKQAIPKSIASAELLAKIMVAKYEDHLPLYRQQAIFERIGIEMSRSTFNHWVFKCAELLSPLVSALKQQILASSYIRCDETTLNVLSRQSERTHCYMWVYCKAMPHEAGAVVYEYHPSRSQEVADALLANFKGYLQTDGYQGYNRLKSQTTITGLGCWAHVRRKFFQILKSSPNLGKAKMALSYIDKLYKTEHRAKQLKLEFDQVKALRQQESVPVLNQFHQWLIKTKEGALPKSPLGQALSYALNQWDTLTVYCQEGYLDIDNNANERLIKPFVCGRKNWLFNGNDKGAQASAIIYSLIQSCKLNGVNTQDYLTWVLKEYPNRITDDTPELYLPQHFKN